MRLKRPRCAFEFDANSFKIFALITFLSDDIVHFLGITMQTYEHHHGQFEIIRFEVTRQQGRYLNFHFHFLERLREKTCKLESRSSESEQTFFVFSDLSWFSKTKIRLEISFGEIGATHF